MWLLSFLLFSACLCCGPPLSSTHAINTREKEREQTIMREEENFNRQRRQVDQGAGQAADVFSPLTLYYHKWKDRDGEDAIDLQKMTHSLSNSHLHQSPTPVITGRHLSVRWNVSNISDTSNATTPNTAAAVITSPHSVLSSSSCSSLACKWLASWQFKAVVSMTLAWLVALMALCLLTRTARGRLLLEAWSSLCTLDTKDQDEVQTKGIGYFDGSPGLRRFVLIEDKEEEDEEDNSTDLSIPEFKGVRSKGDRETESEGENISKKWTPPRKGTYILQEASKEGVLEVGTYRLQEEEEEEEVDRKRKKKKKKEEDKKEEVEYILEGATYILQSERVGRGAVTEGFGHRGGIEGLYGIVGREGLRGRGGFGKIGGLGVYGIMGRGEVRGTGLGGGRYGREEGIEGLYEILQDRATGGGEGDDGVLLSVKELMRAVKGGEKKETVIEEGTSREGTSKELWEGSGREDETGREVRGRGTSGAKMDGGKGVSNRRCEGDSRGEVHMNDTWGGRMRGGVRPKSGGVGEGSWEGRTPPPKRAASFPMDHFLSSHIIPRKLSLIVEEESH